MWKRLIALPFILLSVLQACIAEPKLRVITEDWRPYNYLEQGKVKGRSTEVVEAVLKRAKINYEIEVLPWGRAYQIALSQPNVLIYTMIRIPPRETLFNWIGPLGKGGSTSLYRRKGEQQIQADTLESARQYSVATNLDSMDHLMLRHLGFTQIEVAPRVDQAIRIFFAGRAQLIAFDDAVLDSEFANQQHSKDEVEPLLKLFATPPYIAVSKATPNSIVLKLQSAMTALQNEGLIKPIN